MYLPRYAGAVVAKPLEEIAGAVGAGTGETVLVVDDEPLVRGLIVEVLQELGYGAIEASDGVSAMREIERHPRFDLLVTDVAMPGGMNGRQLADVARQRHPGLGVLFITGFAESIAAGNGALGPDMQVLTNPFTMEALAIRMREMVDGATTRSTSGQ